MVALINRCVLAPTVLAVALAAACATTAMAAEPITSTLTLQDLQRQIEALSVELRAQQEQMAEISAEPVKMRAASATTLGGYGEAYYKRIDGIRDESDAYRLVLFVGHKFSDTLRFSSEIEIEHAYVKDNDNSCTFKDTNNNNVVDSNELVCAKTSTSAGYVAVEQMFIEQQYAAQHRWSAGQLLVPVGILNETHEPETFYGVFRAPVEREIIPGTWFENGVMLSGVVAPGLSYDVLLSSGFKNDGSKALKDGRQRGSKADVSDAAYTARLAYRGVPGLKMAVSWQRQADMAQGALAGNLSGELLETDAVFSHKRFGLRALVAQWKLKESVLAAADKKRAKQTGWYVEPAWKITPTIGVFARYSEWDNEAADAASSRWAERSVGVNWWLHERVVLKADVQRKDDPAANKLDQNGVNMGLGFSF